MTWVRKIEFCKSLTSYTSKKIFLAKRPTGGVKREISGKKI
jgi:hypothetical protein